MMPAFSKGELRGLGSMGDIAGGAGDIAGIGAQLGEAGDDPDVRVGGAAHGVGIFG
jgi:hypothetical protein